MGNADPRPPPAGKAAAAAILGAAAGVLLGVERLSLRKSPGVAIAMVGVLAALATGLSNAPAGAWRGEAIMTGAVLCMAFYNLWSRRFIVRSSALGFLSLGMGVGAAALILAGAVIGRVAVLASFVAALLATQLVGEPITLNLVLGLVAVFAGI